MNKPVSEWPASIIIAIAMTIGCGYVLNTYYGTMMDDIGEFSMPMLFVVGSSVACIGIWVETFRSYRRFQERKSIIHPATSSEQSKMVWPAAKVDTIEPDGKLQRVFKIDE